MALQEVITTGHGSGGILTSKILDHLVFKILDNEYLLQRHDGAQLELSGNCAFSTDSYVITPIFFPGGNIGELAVNGTVNDLAMCGAIPQFLSLSFIIEEGFLMNELEAILLSIKKACEKSGVLVVTGDTKVVERGKGDKIFINTSGIGEVMPQAKISLSRILPTDKVIISNVIANHGVAIMSKRENLEFETAIESDTRNLNDYTRLLIEKYGDRIKLLKDPTRGGVATVLNEIAESSGYGIEIWEDSLPIEDEVRNACEILGLDPLFCANEGVFIAIVSEEIANIACQDLRQFEGCNKAKVIGTVIERNPKRVVIENEIGGKRLVTKLVGEQLPRIC